LTHADIVALALRTAALLGLALSQAADSEKNFPTLLAPVYQFGRAGSEDGAFRAPAGLAVGKDDVLYVADSGNHRVQRLAMNGKVLGSFGSYGRGPSEFAFPTAVAAAPDGEVFVADAAGRLQAFAADGRFLKAWDGLRSPRGVAVSGDRIYVSEGDTHRIRVYSRKDSDATAFGGLGSQPGRFVSPAGVAIDEDGAVYVADSGNHRIQKLDPEGKPLAQWGAWGAQAGLLSNPTGLAYSNGRLTVGDRFNHRVQVFDRGGALLKQWGAAPAKTGDGKGRLHFPEGVAVSPSGGLTVVSEPVDNRIQVFVNRDLAKTQRVNDLPWWESAHAMLHAMRLAPPPPGSPPQVPGALGASDIHAVFLFDLSSGALGPIAAAGGYGRKLGELNGIGGIAVDPGRGRIYVGDRGNRRIVLLDLPRDPKRPEIFAGTVRVVGAHAMDRLVPTPTTGYSPEAAIPGPIVRDGRGRIYLLDRANAAILVCEPDLTFVRLIPVPPTIEEFAVGPDGTLYATDPVHVQVRVFDPEGRPKSPWGKRDEKAEDGLRMPFGIAVDDRSFVYVSDALDDAVKKFDREGRFVKRWGATGPMAIHLASPRGLSYLAPDRLVVDDFGNHRAQVCSTEGEWRGSYVAGGLATPLGIR
jgi:DNA-binding beta-propeller fold protein YncE